MSQEQLSAEFVIQNESLHIHCFQGSGKNSPFSCSLHGREVPVREEDLDAIVQEVTRPRPRRLRRQSQTATVHTDEQGRRHAQRELMTASQEGRLRRAMQEWENAPPVTTAASGGSRGD